jgi:hypothetical protein
LLTIARYISTMAQETLSEVLFEFVQQGRFVRVTAMDPVSRAEAVVVGDAATSPEMLKRVAVNKLRYVMTRSQRQVHAPRREDNLY